MKELNFETTTKFIDTNKEIIDAVKITSMKIGNFNTMEGYQFLINIKVITTDKYKNCLFALHTNSTYMEDFMNDKTEDNGKTNLEECLNSLLY